MNRFVSAWNMRKVRAGFTLIEVMIAVVIISTVIMALLEMRGNSSHLFLNFGKKLEVNQFASFLVSNSEYGFEDDKTTLDKLLSDYDITDDLRRELKNTKLEILHQELKTIDTSEDSEELEDSDENISSSMVFEISKSLMKFEETSTSLIRFRVQ